MKTPKAQKQNSCPPKKKPVEQEQDEEDCGQKNHTHKKVEKEDTKEIIQDKEGPSSKKPRPQENAEDTKEMIPSTISYVTFNDGALGAMKKINQHVWAS